MRGSAPAPRSALRSCRQSSRGMPLGFQLGLSVEPVGCVRRLCYIVTTL